MFGKINLEEFEGWTRLPQKAASAWTAGTLVLMGAGYKPLVYLGTQVVKGVSYYFIAEQTLVTAKPERHVVKMAINDFDGRYKIVPDSIERIV